MKFREMTYTRPDIDALQPGSSCAEGDLNAALDRSAHGLPRLLRNGFPVRQQRAVQIDGDHTVFHILITQFVSYNKTRKNATKKHAPPEIFGFPSQQYLREYGREAMRPSFHLKLGAYCDQLSNASHIIQNNDFEILFSCIDNRISCSSRSAAIYRY